MVLTCTRKIVTMTDMKEKYIVYMYCHHQRDAQELFLVKDDFKGKQSNKKFFPAFEEAKEYDSYEDAFKDIVGERDVSIIKNLMNKYVFIDIHPRYRYA